jgi:ribonuclease HI
MIISSDVKYPKKRYRLKQPIDEIYNKLIKDKITERNENVNKTRNYTFNIYTDGGFNNVYNIGAWSYIIKVKHDRSHFKFHKGGGTLGLNHRSSILMELTAVIDAINFIVDEKNVVRYNYAIENIVVYSDNLQVVNSRIQYKKYETNDWKFLTNERDMYENLKEAWKSIHNLNEKYNISYKWVKGHSGNVSNEYCDKACRSRIKNRIVADRIMC